METKIYLIEEHQDMLFDGESIDKWNELIDKLGLENQKKFTDGTKSPMPFPRMTNAQDTIYTAILETKVEYKRYSSEVIPLRVLEMIDFCEREKHFDLIEIWYSEKNPDPLVVGRIYTSDEYRQKNYTWSMTNYLIAQWGDKIKPISVLIPAYDEYYTSVIVSEYETKLRQHKESIQQFKFQALAYETNIRNN